MATTTDTPPTAHEAAAIPRVACEGGERAPLSLTLPAFGGRRLDVEDDRYGAVVHDLDDHPCAEDARFERDAEFAKASQNRS